jgi:hypothetical protein
VAVALECNFYFFFGSFPCFLTSELAAKKRGESDWLRESFGWLFAIVKFYEIDLKGQHKTSESR